MKNIQIVLCNPHDSRNIGAACRAVKAMGLQHLVICGNPEIDDVEAGRLAVHAQDVLRNADRVQSLKEAVGGCSLVAGVTRRRGQKRKYVYSTPRDFAEKIHGMPGARIAVVFGNETSGLSDEELAQCHAAISIPSHPDCPSLNLSHAVQVVAYELFVASQAPADQSFYQPLDGEGLTALTDKYIDVLHSIGYATQEGPRGMPVFLRDAFARASLSAEEAERLMSLASKVEGLFQSKS